ELDHPPFDILHFHDWHCIDALDRLQNRNTVLSFHSTEYGRNGANFGDSWEFREISGKEWYGGYIAKRILTVSKNTKTEIMWLYNVPERKITVVPNGIYPERFFRRVDAAAVKTKYGIHPLAPLVLFVGRLAYQKGPDLLLKAIPRVLAKRWDVQFLIAGDGALRPQLESMASGLPVQFLGYIDDATLLDLLNACDVMVIPSRNEPFGLVLTEAWSAGRCVVATDVGGLGENIENFVDGITVPAREESIAWGINYVIDDPVLMQRLGRAGRMKVLTEFDWDLIVEQTLEVYSSMLDRGETQQ
ncbi:MAG: glycosyltransferase family 4 protein, partial [Methanoregulaceae archaeon]|nr:glycosyltransferase family 4 protein [Methanoregulaceae archaeon]